MAATRSVLVTGGNNGIGYEIVRALFQSEKAYRIFMGSRSLDRAAASIEKLQKQYPNANNTIEPIQLELASDVSIQAAFEKIKGTVGSLDTLINNAGATFDLEFLAGNVTLRESFVKACDVNVAGTQVVTWTFMPLLLKSSEPRLLLISGLSNINKASKEYFPTPPLPAGWPKKIEFETIAYRCSKMAVNMLAVDWNHKLKADGVKVFAVAPGFVATDLGGRRDLAESMGAGDPSVSGQFIKTIVEGQRDADVGKLISKDGILEW